MSNQNANSATPLNVSCYEPNELLFKVPESLRKAFFLQFFSLLTWKSALNLPTVIFLSKGRKFLALCSTWIQIIRKFQKVSQVVPLWFSIFFRNFKLLNWTKTFEFWHASRKTWAKSLKNFAHATFFSRIVRKTSRQVPKVMKEKVFSGKVTQIYHLDRLWAVVTSDYKSVCWKKWNFFF